LVDGIGGSTDAAITFDTIMEGVDRTGKRAAKILRKVQSGASKTIQSLKHENLIQLAQRVESVPEGVLHIRKVLDLTENACSVVAILNRRVSNGGRLLAHSARSQPCVCRLIVVYL
jgi:hypothetical protein